MFNKLKNVLCICLFFVSVLIIMPQSAQAQQTQVRASAMMVQAAALGENYIKPILAKLRMFRSKRSLNKNVKRIAISYRHEDGVQVDCGLKKCAMVFE